MKISVFKYVFYFGFISCSANRNIIGTYSKDISSHLSYSITVLDSNQFEFESRVGLAEKKTYGSYDYFKGKLVLNSNADCTKENGKVTAEYKEDLKGTLLKFYYFDGVRPYKNLEVLVNDSVKLQTDESGVIRFDGIVVNIYVEFLPHCVYYYEFGVGHMNYYSVYLTPSNGSAVVFRQRSLKINKRGIKFNRAWLIKV